MRVRAVLTRSRVVLALAIIGLATVLSVGIVGQHPKGRSPGWTSLPDAVPLLAGSAHGGSMGEAGGQGPGVLRLTAQTSLAIVGYVCRGAGTLVLSLGGGSVSGACFAGQTTEYVSTLRGAGPSSIVTVRAPANVQWRVAAGG